MMNEKAKKAFQSLLEGNENFVNGRTTAADNRGIKTLQALRTSQSPIACVLTCSDSRVIPEFIFDKGFGDLFVVRGAGAVVGPNILESVEYAVDQLDVSLVVVMSHENCGVMKTAVSKYPAEPEDFHVLIKSVYEIIDRDDKTYDEIAHDYTLVKKRKLLKRSSIIRHAYAEGKIDIVRAYLDFESGRVKILG